MIKQSVQFGRPLPKEIVEAPELFVSLQLFWKCYFDLRRGLDRTAMLTWRDVQAWCDTYNLDGETARACHDYTLEMDYIWKTLLPTKSNKPGAENGLGSGNKRG